MSRAPSLPLFCGDYIADTKHLSLEEHGAYLLLLMIAWRSPSGTLDDDDTRLARMLGVTPRRWKTRLRPVVSQFFAINGGKWTQKRLMAERNYVEERRKQKVRAGKASALKRQQSGPTDASHPLQQNGQQNGNPQPQPHKEVPDTKVSEGKPEDGLLEIPPFLRRPQEPDLLAEVFAKCLPALMEWAGLENRKARSLLGKWVKEHGEARVLAAFSFTESRTEGPPDEPISWLENWLRRDRLTPGEDDVVGGSEPALLRWRGQMLREVERRRGLAEAERVGDAFSNGEQWAVDALHAISRAMKEASA